MEGIVKTCLGSAPNEFERATCRVLTVYEALRYANVPVSKLGVDRFNPCADPGFAPVNLLPTADETDNRRPIRMTIKTRDKEFRLGHPKVLDAFLALHEPFQF